MREKETDYEDAERQRVEAANELETLKQDVGVLRKTVDMNADSAELQLMHNVEKAALETQVC